MEKLEQIVEKPFEEGTYSFDLNWNGLRTGNAELSFAKIEETDLPDNARKLYSRDAELYKVVFNGRLDVPILGAIFKGGNYTAYIQIQGIDVRPLMSVLEIKLFRSKIISSSLYDYENCNLFVNNKSKEIQRDKMEALKDPVSHVISLLFRPRKGEENYFCGYYNDGDGNLKELWMDYNFKEDKLVGSSFIPAGAYFLSIGVTLKLPYSFDKKSGLFLPSLKERVRINPSYLGSVEFNFKEVKKERNKERILVMKE